MREMYIALRSRPSFVNKFEIENEIIDITTMGPIMNINMQIWYGLDVRSL